MDPYILVGLCDWNEKWRLSRITGLDCLQYTAKLREVLGVETDEALVTKLSGLVATEPLDEIHTADLQYVLAKYLAAIGMMNSEWSGRREVLLIDVRRQLKQYVESTAIQYNSDRVVEQWKMELSEASEKSRDKVIRRRRVTDSLERGIQCPPGYAKQAQQLCTLADRIATYDDLILKMEQETVDDDEELSRELWLNLIELSLHMSISEISLLDSEINLLREIDTNRNKMDNQVLPPSSDSRLDSRSLPPASKPYIVKINDKSELYKLYSQQVFQAPFTQPTMTLAECVEKEIEQDIHQLGAAQVRSMEKPEEDEDTKERRERDWDDWKDVNPKGSGNKMVNRG